MYRILNSIEYGCYPWHRCRRKHYQNIDVGGSTTKIVGIENGKLKSPLFITATDPVTSLFGAFGKYLYDNQFNLEDIEQIILTGVGSAYINTPLYGRPTAKTDEFIANALGAKYQSGLDRLIAVSMGTGTSFIQIEGDAIKHLGGTGIWPRTATSQTSISR